MNEYMDQQDNHPCTTRPLDANDIYFNIQSQQDFHKLMNVCNQHRCSLACYKNNKDFKNQLCRYKFPQTLIQETHFEHEFEFLHMKRNDKWLNNANPWIMNVCHCNHDLKFIVVSRKDSKTLIY
jgi:hypothetical protein